MDGLYYEGCRERFLDASQPDKAMVTEPYDYEGSLQVEQSYPISRGGTFQGVAGVDRELSGLVASLQKQKAAQLRAGWHVEIFLVSRLGKVIASTLKTADLQTKAIADTPYAGIFSRFQNCLLYTSPSPRDRG